MRLPCHTLRSRADRNRANAKDEIDSEPNREKSKNARALERFPKRQRRNTRRSIGIAAPE